MTAEGKIAIRISKIVKCSCTQKTTSIFRVSIKKLVSKKTTNTPNIITLLVKNAKKTERCLLATNKTNNVQQNAQK